MPSSLWFRWIGGVCAIGLSCHAQAMGWFFEPTTPVESVMLSAAEYKQLKINAGWVAGDAQTMVFEVHNPLPGAVFCPVVQWVDKNDKTSTKELRPKLYLPTDATRKAGVSSLEKDKINSDVLVCTCNKALQGPAVCRGS
jgi:hypothetical protein